MNPRKILFPLLATCALSVPTLAQAAPPGGDAGAQSTPTAVETPAQPASGKDSKAKLSKRKDQKWIKRWAPEPNMGEIGIYGGAVMIPYSHELFQPDRRLPDQGWKSLRHTNPEFGLRMGYYPSRFLGIEAEGGVMPAKLRDQSGNALLYTARAHVVLQLGLWSVTPFVLVGAGGLGVASPRDSLGKDIDAAVHFGGGLKFYLSRHVMLRFDVRDVVSKQRGVDAKLASHNLEALLGLSFTLGREKDRDIRKPSDRDHDGFEDDNGQGISVDACPDQYGGAPSGCPILDRDADGLLDDRDVCPDQPETVNQFDDGDGCPETDRDADGFWDDQGHGRSLDNCPDQAGVAPDGCPILDLDDDGILDPADTCSNEAETHNGFDDLDGCPDQLPTDLQRFTGPIKGISFDAGKATLRTASRTTLDELARILAQYPDVRIRISAHTEDKGDHDANVELSQRRADAVKAYLTEKGIDGSRIEAMGHGPDQPIDTNDTKAGRDANRRVELEVLSTPPSIQSGL